MVRPRCCDYGRTGSGVFVSVPAVECFRAGEFFSAGTQALCCCQLSVSVLALWHSKVKGFLFLSFAVLALSHSRTLKECFNAGTEVLIGFQFSVSVLAKCNFGGQVC